MRLQWNLSIADTHETEQKAYTTDKCLLREVEVGRFKWLKTYQMVLILGV